MCTAVLLACSVSLRLLASIGVSAMRAALASAASARQSPPARFGRRSLFTCDGGGVDARRVVAYALTAGASQLRCAAATIYALFGWLESCKCRAYLSSARPRTPSRLATTTH